MKDFYFIRHGETVANAEGIYGDIDTQLTDKGRKQALETSKSLQGIDIDCVYSSPIERSAETAQIVVDAIGFPKDEIIYDDDLKERDTGDLTGKHILEEGHIMHIKAGHKMETLEEMFERASRFLERIEEDKSQHILVVSHSGFGAVLRAARQGKTWKDELDPSGFPNVGVLEFS